MRVSKNIRGPYVSVPLIGIAVSLGCQAGICLWKHPYRLYRLGFSMLQVEKRGNPSFEGLGVVDLFRGPLR